ncbi:hypothetical protein ACFQ2M_06165 [Kitasatospora saccharophila]|uniref:hypothetical protein n=1 Tax=Kitasatospora saccharophila TaxID=407973 RepID=UPI00363FFFFD
MRDRRGRDPGAQPGTRVAVVDDDTVIREGLPHLLPGVRVVLAVSSVEELLAARPETDAVLLDLVLTGTGRTGCGRAPPRWRRSPGPGTGR